MRRNVEVTISDKHTYKAQVILQDKAHDLALLQIDAKNLTPSILSESSDLQVGQNVYAIGNPFGLNGTMTTGIISSIRSVQEPQGPPSIRPCKPTPPSIPGIPADPCSTRAVK